jgi:hypothetical protein
VINAGEFMDDEGFISIKELKEKANATLRKAAWYGRSNEYDEAYSNISPKIARIFDKMYELESGKGEKPKNYNELRQRFAI